MRSSAGHSGRRFAFKELFMAELPTVQFDAELRQLRTMADGSCNLILNIPEYVMPLGMVYFGYPAEEKEPRTRYNEKRVYWQEYDPNRKHRTKDTPKKGHY